MHPHVPIAFCGGALVALIAIKVLGSFRGNRSEDAGTTKGAGKANASVCGDDVVFVTAERLTAGPLINAVSSPKAGAIVTFNGVTRDNFDGQAVTRLECVLEPRFLTTPFPC